jgi:hypothetical protein
MKTLILALILSGPMLAASAESPVKEPKFDRTDWALLSAVAGSRALDTYSTRWMLGQGDHELILPGFVVNHTPVLAGVEAGSVVADYFATRYLMRHHHPKLAKIALMADFAADAPGAIHNLFLKPGVAKVGAR